MLTWRVISFEIRLRLSIACLGDSSEGVTPVPIPNTEVKPLSADGTVRETGWESRSLPGFYKASILEIEAFSF